MIFLRKNPSKSVLWGIGDHRADDADPGKIAWTPVRSVHAAISLVELP